MAQKWDWDWDKSSKYRNWCFTSYKIDDLEPWGYSYVVGGLETCPTTGRVHIQGYIEFKNAVYLSGAQKRIGDKVCHCAPRYEKSTAAQAAEYCKKDGDYFENGTITNQGARTDLKTIKDNILNHKSNIRDMLENDTIINHQQLRFAESLQKYVRPQKREPPQVFWFYGDTGTGKTRFVYDNEDDIFRVEPGFEWYDGYIGQEAVLFDELRGEIKLSTLLCITDRYPLSLKIKTSFTQWKPKRIYITSCKSPEECYKNCHENIGQLLRRITEVRFFGTKVTK